MEKTTQSKPFHGVNLGNWLVLEMWMSPEMFDGTDAEDETWLNREASWGKIPTDSFWAKLPVDDPGYQAGPMTREKLEQRMRYHRETYVQEKDFEWLHNHGITHVRIPVPFFIFGDRKPYCGCLEYLDRAFVWAKKHQIRILIDLHTACGGQNGYDNGGITGVCKWHKNPEEVEFVLHVLERLAERYAKDSALYGLEVLNEPISRLVYLTAPSTGQARDPEEAEGSGYVPTIFLKDFYRRAYHRIRRYLPESKTIVFHDGFRLNVWGDYFVRHRMKNVCLDTHMYVFAMENFFPVHKPWVYRTYLAINKQRIRLAQKYTPVIVGEWCVTNEYAFGMRKDFTKGALSGMATSPDAKQYQINAPIPEQEKRKRFLGLAHAELRTWEETEGWFYWNYQLLRDRRKKENAASDAGEHKESTQSTGAGKQTVEEEQKEIEYLTITDEYFKEAWDFARCMERGWLPSAWERE
ncbi:MAG: cellulase family glycosylhydrolase [Bilifractor sp.]|nr:cellulase family glycosylhydrolase [Lachnospiraceae bacterium]MDY2836631.1 cellulase family glycosylhydrolase [Bilifractor sp.]